MGPQTASGLRTSIRKLTISREVFFEPPDRRHAGLRSLKDSEAQFSLTSSISATKKQKIFIVMLNRRRE
jgi:hypothetical protein